MRKEKRKGKRKGKDDGKEKGKRERGRIGVMGGGRRKGKQRD